MKNLKNSTGGEECSRLVFSSLGSVLEESRSTEILFQSQLYPLNRRVDLTLRSMLLCSESRSSLLFPNSQLAGHRFFFPGN